MEESKMEKSHLEKALEKIPIYKDGSLQIIGDQGRAGREDELDIPERYMILRQAELAYEQLAASGINVSAQLRERRCQIAELVADVLEGEAGNVGGMLEHRSKDYIGDLPNMGPTMIECVEKLYSYLIKLYPESFKKDKLAEKLKLFPEP